MKRFIFTLAIIVTCALPVYAGDNCNYTMQDLYNQLYSLTPTINSKNSVIVKQNEIDTNICRILMQITTTKGHKYASVFEIGGSGVAVYKGP